MSYLSSLETCLTELSFLCIVSQEAGMAVANSYKKTPLIFCIPHPNILLSVPNPRFYWHFSRNVKQSWYAVTHFCSSVLLLGEKNSPSLTFFLSLSHFGTGCKDISCVYCVGFPQWNDWKQMCEYAHAHSPILAHGHMELMSFDWAADDAINLYGRFGSVATCRYMHVVCPLSFLLSPSPILLVFKQKTFRDDPWEC